MSCFYNQREVVGFTFDPNYIVMRNLSEISHVLLVTRELVAQVVSATNSLPYDKTGSRDVVDSSARFYVALSLLLTDGAPASQARLRVEALDSLITLRDDMRRASLSSNGRLKRLQRNAEPVLRMLKEKVLCC